MFTRLDEARSLTTIDETLEDAPVAAPDGVAARRQGAD